MTSRELDQFYTSPKTSEALMQKIKQLISEDRFANHKILEPSAGDGSFSDHLLTLDRDFIAIDLDPKKPYIQQADFLEWRPNPSEKYVTIGNPPFGKNSSLAIKFFNKSAEFSDLISFVIPKTFQKNSTKNKLNLNFHLLYEEELPLNSFVFNGEPYSVPCCFQVWEKKSSQRSVYNAPKTSDFDFVDPQNADIAFQRVGVNAGKITMLPDCKSKNVNSHIFIKFNSNSAKEKFIKTNFDKYKLMTAGNPSISKGEILEIWSES